MDWKCNPCTYDTNPKSCPKNCEQARKREGLTPFPEDGTDLKLLHSLYDKPFIYGLGGME